MRSGSFFALAKDAFFAGPRCLLIELSLGSIHVVVPGLNKGWSEKTSGMAIVVTLGS